MGQQSVAFFTIIIEPVNIYTFTKLVSQHFLNEKTAIDKLLISNCENNLRKQCTIGNFVTIRIWNVLRTVLLSPHWWHTLPRSLWWTILNQKRCPNVKTIFQFSLNEYFRKLTVIAIYHIVKRDVFIDVTWQHILSGN